jgi:molecular chaperone HtpG
MNEKGNISINTDNIFPIIKKWLYSDRDIFLREIISNSCDAISKIKKLISLNEVQGLENKGFKVTVSVNKNKKTISVTDNGIGMTADEVKKYINQIAFSGAKDFIEKYKDKTDDDSIIGHFGLGFYSTFMVSEKVEINTLSFEKDAIPVKWISEGGIEFELSESDRTERGTTVTLYLAEDSVEYSDINKARQILEKYCSFLPYEIYLEDELEVEKAKKDAKKAEKKDAKKAEKKDAKKAEKKDSDSVDSSDGTDDSDNVDEVKAPKPINDIKPLWLKNPKDCTDEEYKGFFKKVFNDFNEPLFWIHLNMDYPFNLKGILYFPKLQHQYETIEGQIKLYCNQVFVADNIKEVIPEFLMLLKGTIDCPDLPLNVSRSFLQNDGYVSKISSHIIKKVADKLNGIFKKDRASYNKYWEDINPFVKYGCMKETKFYEKMKDTIIFKTTNEPRDGDVVQSTNPATAQPATAGGLGDSVYTTLKEYLNRNESKHKNTVFYVSDERQQAQYIKMFKDNDMEAVILDGPIDNHFVTFIEYQGHEVKFTRIDSDVTEHLKDTNINESEDTKQTEILEKIFKEATGNANLKVKAQGLKATDIPSMIILSEQSRRMQEMSHMFGGMDMKGMFPNEETLILNTSNSLIKTLIDMADKGDKTDDLNLISAHIYDLAMMSHKPLAPEAMTGFIDRSNKILGMLAAR